MLYYILFTYIFFFLFNIFYINALKLNNYSYTSIFLHFYLIFFLLGTMSIYILNLKYNNDIINYSIFLFILSIIVFYFSHFISKVFLQKIKIEIFPNINYSKYKKLYLTLLSISFMAIVLYVIKSGGFMLLNMNSNEYELSIENNAGLGIFTIFFTMYIPGTLLFYQSNPSKKNFWISLFIMIVFGLLIYLAIGGSRRFLFYGIISLYIFALLRKDFRLSFIKLLFYIIITFFLLNLMALIRYGNDITNIDFTLILFYTFGSLAPWSSFLDIIQNVPNNFDYQYFTLIFNHFLKIVPRFIWQDKPLLIENTGNFYTQNFLNIDNLTISPSLLGELFLAFGTIGIVVGMVAIGSLFALIDKIQLNKNKNILALIFFSYNINVIFGLTREGVEVFIYNILFNFMLFLLFIFYIKLKLKKA